MLATTDEDDAVRRVQHLETLNLERKSAVAQITKELHKRLEVMTEVPPVFVFGNPDWRPSLVGLAANKLAEEHNRPAFVWGRDGNGVIKGSCRSGGEVSVVKVMEAAPHLFIEFGGHHASGGFSVKEEHIHTFAGELLAAFVGLGTAAVVAEPYQVDLELSLDCFTSELLKAQRRLAPFGAANHKPLYLIKDVTPKAVQVFGKTKEHTKLQFYTTGIVKEAIAFFRTPEQFKVVPTIDGPISLLVHLEESFFMNRLETRLRIVDIF